MKILILLSTYNGEKYIKTQLDSILSQIGVEPSILIRDDGSNDKTIDIINSYISKYNNIRIIIGENLGYALSFTELLKYAYTSYKDIDFYAFADQDDVWLPNKLSKAIEKISQEPSKIPITYCSNTTLVDQNLNILHYSWNIKPSDITKSRSLIQNFATGCTMVFNRKAVEVYVKHLPKEIKIHDYLMYQICIFMGKVLYDEESYILYRQHGNNQIGKPSFIKRMKIRTKGLYKQHTHENRNKIFLDTFKSELSEEDVKLITDFISYRKSITNRIKLLFNPKISIINSFEANVFLKIKIILGWI